MSPNLESRLAAWRQSMQAAGISPGERRDELESHLRDGFEMLVNSGMDPALAFATAAEKLGAPAVIQQEFVASMSPAKRLQAFLKEPFGFFPTNLTVCAWAALLFGPMIMLSAFSNAANNGIFARLLDPSARSAGWPFALACLAGFLFGLLGLLGGVGYLRKRNFASSSQLAGFWIFFFWYAGILMIYLTVHFGEPAFGVEAWPPLMAAPVAIVAYFAWRKRLRTAIPAART